MYASSIYLQSNVNPVNSTTVSINVNGQTRSRRSQFVFYSHYSNACCDSFAAVAKGSRAPKHRDRAPSRLSLKTLQRLSRKNWKVKQYFYRRMCVNIPKSSEIHRYYKISAGSYSNVSHLFKHSAGVMYFYCNTTEFQYRARKYLSLIMNNLPLSFYKAASHRAIVYFRICNSCFLQ